MKADESKKIKEIKESEEVEQEHKQEKTRKKHKKRKKEEKITQNAKGQHIHATEPIALHQNSRKVTIIHCSTQSLHQASPFPCPKFLSILFFSFPLLSRLSFFRSHLERCVQMGLLS